MRNAKPVKIKTLVPVMRTAVTADLAYVAVCRCRKYAGCNVLIVQSLHVRLQAVLAAIYALAILQPASGRIARRGSAAMSAMRA